MHRIVNKTASRCLYYSIINTVHRPSNIAFSKLSSSSSRLFKAFSSSKPTNSSAGRKYSSINKSVAVRRRRNHIPIYLLSFLSINAFSIYTHYDDEYFFYLYPFPFALDVGHGPSMLPTMKNSGSNLYWRDCLSHRFVWLNFNHLQNGIKSLLSRQSAGIGDTITFKRPWQNGDVVTLYNPYTKSIVTKRIIGVGGDSVQVFGEYAQEYTNATDDELSMGENYFGVPHDPRFTKPFCQRASSLLESGGQKQQDATITVPENHVWVEGDNPLESTDSRHYGPLLESALRGRVILRLLPFAGGWRLVSSERPVPSTNHK